MVTIPGVLDAGLLARVNAALDGAGFTDGRRSAGRTAALVKRNQELAGDDALAIRLNGEVLGPLNAHPSFQAAAMPLRLSGALFARYRDGMAYGPHTDDPLMGAATAPYRCDVAVTVFLTAPEDYTGGELVVMTAFGERAIRAPAGAAVVYPASSLHRVEPVRTGERRVAVAFAQSMVRDPERRALLYDLWCAREALRGGLPTAAVSGEVDRVYSNLVRMWAEV